MTIHFNKFKLLIWKEWTLLKRRPIRSAFEIICPVMISMILVLVRGAIDVQQKGPITYPPFNVTNYEEFYNCSEKIMAAYSPQSPLLYQVVHNSLWNMCRNSEITLEEFEIADDLNNQIDNNRNFTKILTVAVQFSDNLRGIKDRRALLSNVNVTLRLPTVLKEKEEWFTNYLYPVFQQSGPRSNRHSATGGVPNYLQRGFLSLQEEITSNLLNNAHLKLQIVMRRFPYPKYLDDMFYANSMHIMGSIIITSIFLFSYLNTIRAITTEKEKQLKECMKIMGLPRWLHWITWFLRSFIMLLLALIFVVLLLTTKIQKVPVFTYSSWSVIFLFLVLAACSTITFTFFISAFFSKVNTATAAGSLMFILTYTPYVVIQQSSFIIKSKMALPASLLPNSALPFGVGVIFKFEALKKGVQWSNLWSTASPDDDLTLGSILLMLMLDAILYLLLSLYIEVVFPGDYGVPQPWYFPFTCTFKKSLITTTETVIGTIKDYEDFTEKLPIGIQLCNLSKTFKNSRAVKRVNLNMYEGHITVLLGHNGAGKTTTMSMITGMFPPTTGTVIVNGYDVRSDAQSVRDSMGLCLQHNVLFDDLTVYEHLYFFCKLKGVANNEINQEINNYIRLLQLEDKRHARSSTLSGGTKRKLSVGMALCGKSKVVILDEPTAGMDPCARRTVWNLLQKEKEGRTILLTTHFMDEADLLGDRIAIMTDGVLQCCGSSFFLKRKYGAGYYLILDVTASCQPKKVTLLLKKYIPGIEIFSQVGSELTYQLSESESCKFESMLHDLEQNITSLGIQSYGVSLTTLEEVFMKVGADQNNQSSKSYIKNEQYTNVIRGHDPEKMNIEYVTGLTLLKNQFIAMFLKRALSTIRSWHLFLIQVGLPVVLLTITIVCGRRWVPLSRFPSLKITLSSYDHPVTLVEGSTREQFYQQYLRMLKDHEVKKVSDVGDAIFNLTSDSPFNVQMHYIVGATFSKDVITAWFNGDPYHSTPLSMSLVLNALYKEQFGSDSSINFINHPLPLTFDAQLDDLRFNMMGYQIALDLANNMAFTASLYILFYVRERVSKVKHLQFVSGVNVVIFWGASFLWDVITYILMMCFILITLVAVKEDGFKSPEEIGHVAVILVYFGLFALPLIYLASFLFSRPSNGFSLIMIVGSFTGIIGITVMQILEFESLGLLNIANILHWVLLFIPFYSIAKGIYDMSSIHSLRNLCLPFSNLSFACSQESTCCGIDNFYSFTTPGIGRNIVISISMSIFLFIVLIINEHGFFNSVKKKIFNYDKPPLPNDDLEPDVKEENYKIKTASDDFLNNNYSLVLRDLTKYYKNFLAVNGLCLGVKPFECFGLLGVNGAGKTTTFKMMTGDEEMSYGDAWINGFSIKKDQKKVQKLLGYCPQFDALFAELTARETLRIFSLIRGVPKNHCDYLAEHLSHKFDFYQHLDKKVTELSGGNRRKLNTALTLVGDPPIIFLDEPSAGMDPATKRFLWTALSKLRDRGKCIILTSHSMEECEALCTKLAIMVNGKFECLGSTQRLKNKFAQGHALTIKMRKVKNSANLKNEISAINVFVQKHFPGAELKEKYQELLSYHLKHSSMPWSQMFGILERSKHELKVEDYSIGQCSLDQVFLSFTKDQK